MSSSLCLSDGLTVSFFVSGSIYISCLKNLAKNLPTRVRCIYCWKKGVKDGLMGRWQWTTPRELWAGQSDNCTHKERSVIGLIACNNNATSSESKHSGFSFALLRVNFIGNFPGDSELLYSFQFLIIHAWLMWNGHAKVYLFLWQPGLIKTKYLF